MIRIKLSSVMVSDQARARSFYTEKFGFVIKHDLPCGDAAWLTVVSPADPDGTELLLEPAGQDFALAFKKGLVDSNIPATAFAVDSVQAEYDRMLALGVVFTQPPIPMGPTIIAVLDDTCGNLIQIYEG